MQTSSYITETGKLSSHITEDNLLIVDMGSADQYQKAHLPGAVHLDINKLRLGIPPAPGLLPDIKQLEKTLQFIGLNDDTNVVAYDHDFNLNACRLLWCLEVSGHTNHALLNGGVTAWREANFKIQTKQISPAHGNFTLKFCPEMIADKAYVLNSINNPDIIILDARSPDEFSGLKSPSIQHGHIPGAINLDWLDTVDQSNNNKFKSRKQLKTIIDRCGISKDKEIIVHCQTHQRSSHSFVMLKSLGFGNVRGYAGSWSEWGNDLQLPVAR